MNHWGLGGYRCIGFDTCWCSQWYAQPVAHQLFWQVYIENRLPNSASYVSSDVKKSSVWPYFFNQEVAFLTWNDVNGEIYVMVFSQLPTWRFSFQRPPASYVGRAHILCGVAPEKSATVLLRWHMGLYSRTCHEVCCQISRLPRYRRFTWVTLEISTRNSPFRGVTGSVRWSCN